MLKIGRLYIATDYGGFWTKPANAELLKSGYPVPKWPDAFSNPEYPEDGLFKETLCYLGTETINDMEYNKFLWQNKIVYNRALSAIEFEYRFDEIVI